jgi:hypothetical protein
MGFKYSIVACLLLYANIVCGQYQYVVTRNTYLKKNPDVYSDNILFISEGTTLYRLANTDYPYYLVKYNGEVGYVNRLDLSTSEGITPEIESPPLEEAETVEPLPPVKFPEEKENESSNDVASKTWKDWLVLPKLPSIIKLESYKKYFWFLLIIPGIFLTLFIMSLLRARKRKLNEQGDYYTSSGNQENNNI